MKHHMLNQMFVAFVLITSLLSSLAGCKNDEADIPSASSSMMPNGSKNSSTIDETRSEVSAGSDSRIEQMENAVLQYPGENEEWKYNVYDCYVELTDYKGPIVETLVVPAEIEGLPVWKYSLNSLDDGTSSNYGIKIDGDGYVSLRFDVTTTYARYADADFVSPYWKLFLSQKLETVELPNCLLSIGSYAFFGHENLSKINLPVDLNYIGDYAFAKCNSLTQIDIPDPVQIIGPGTFSQSGLTSVKIPVGLKSIDIGAFRNCGSLKEVTIPETVESISESAFFLCNTDVDSMEKGSIDITILGTDTLILNDTKTITFANFSTVHGYAGSEAAKYCAEWNIPFQLISG